MPEKTKNMLLSHLSKKLLYLRRNHQIVRLSDIRLSDKIDSIRNRALKI